jgi:hypothetical protein
MLEEPDPMPEGLPLLMDRACEGNETRRLVLDLGMTPRWDSYAANADHGLLRIRPRVIEPHGSRFTPFEALPS